MGLLATTMASSIFGVVRMHLADVAANPAKALDDRLLETLNGQVLGAHLQSLPAASSEILRLHAVGDIGDSDRTTIINEISELLPTLQQDPSPITALIETLISSEKFDFDRVLAIEPAIDFAAGLASSSPPINSITLILLSKAKHGRGYSEIVAGRPEMVAALIRLWLATPETAVADKAQEVLLGLLQAHHVYLAEENDEQRQMFYEGLMWRRFVRDRDIYGSIFALCSLSTAGKEGQPNKRQKTVAQARLLDLILQIDCDDLRTSQFPDIEEQYGVRNGGLLDFAALHMVDYKDDVLMHMTLIDFYTKYLCSTFHSKSIVDFPLISSKALDFLVEKGLHSRSMSYYLQSDNYSHDSTWLYDSSADYLSTYCFNYPTHLLDSSPPLVDTIHTRLRNILDDVSSSQWAQNLAPTHDLRVLVSLPRIALLQNMDRSSPLFFVRPQPANAVAFGTLAAIFHGDTVSHRSNLQNVDENISQEAGAARALYFRYLDNFPQLWTRVIRAAETIALKDTALAALDLIGAVITARWAPLPTNSETNNFNSQFSLPSEPELSQKCHSNRPLPPSGITAVLETPALEAVIAYLLRPAQSFSNLVGGRGDTESAAYKVAVRKYEVLEMLHRELLGVANSAQQLGEIVAAVKKRLGQGPMGGSSDVGGNVGTMEL